jgi:hypothetical protein
MCGAKLTVAARALIGKQIRRVAIKQHDSFGSDASSGIHPPEELVRNPTSNQTVGFALRAPAALFLDQRERPCRQTAREHGRCSSYSGRDRQHRYDRLLKSGERPLLYSRDDGQCTRRHPTILPTQPRSTHSRTPRRPQESRSVNRLVDAMVPQPDPCSATKSVHGLPHDHYNGLTRGEQCGPGGLLDW